MFFSSDGLVHVATMLGSLTASSTTTADLLVAASVLQELLSPTILDSLTPSLLQPLVSAVSNLTSPSRSQQWRQVAVGNTLLLTLEMLVNRSVLVSAVWLTQSAWLSGLLRQHSKVMVNYGYLVTTLA